MATLTAGKAAVGVMPKGLRAGLVAVTSTYSLAANLSAGDVIQMVKVPANATPVYVAVWSTAGGAGSVNVGDGGSANRYLNNYLYSAAGAYTPINTQYAPYTYSIDDTIDITISAVSAAASTGGFTMVAIFSMDT